MIRPVGDDWEITVPLNAYSGLRTGAEPWTGELVIRPVFRAAVIAGRDDWREAAQHAAAVAWQALGFRLGERPEIISEKPLPDDRVGVRVRALVTVPPFWCGPPEDHTGQLGLWGQP